MGRMGFGVNIFALFGQSEGSAKYIGRKITAAELVKSDGKPSCGEPGDELHLTFEDGAKISLRDEGQSCCESRYITCDDDLSKIVGGKLTRMESKDAPTISGEYGDEHNGYYGGFALAIKELTPAVPEIKRE